jgi:hypothetical protein
LDYSVISNIFDIEITSKITRFTNLFKLGCSFLIQKSRSKSQDLRTHSNRAAKFKLMSVSFSHLIPDVYPELNLNHFCLWKKTLTSGEAIPCRDSLRFVCAQELSPDRKQIGAWIEAMNKVEEPERRKTNFLASVPMDTEFHYFTILAQRKQKKWFWHKDVWIEVTNNWSYAEDGTLYQITKKPNSNDVKSMFESSLISIPREVIDLIVSYECFTFPFPFPFQLSSWNVSGNEWKVWKQGLLTRLTERCFQKVLAIHFDILKVNTEGNSCLYCPEHFLTGTAQMVCPIHGTKLKADVLLGFRDGTQKIFLQSWPKNLYESKSFKDLWMKKKTKQQVPTMLCWCKEDTHMISKDIL